MRGTTSWPQRLWAAVLAPGCVGFSEGCVTPLVRQHQRAAAQMSLLCCGDRNCPGPAAAGLSWAGIAALWLQNLLCSPKEHSCQAHLHGENSSCCLTRRKGAAWSAPGVSLATSAVRMLKLHLGFLKTCDWQGGRDGLVLFTLIQVSQRSCPGTSGSSSSCRSTVGMFTAPGRIPQMNIDIKVLPLLMSIDVLFSVLTVLGDGEAFTG